jgi:hypothetical protein
VADGALTIDLFPGWGANGDVTLAAIEILQAEADPQGPRNFQASTAGDGTYDLSWEIPAGAAYDGLNVLSRMSGQTLPLADSAATSASFTQELAYESTANEGFVLQARSGNVFHTHVHAGAGVPPMRINAGGAGDLYGCNPPACDPPVPPTFGEAPITARGLTWVSDLAYVDTRHELVAPLVSGDRNYVIWSGQPFQVTEDSPASELDPPFANPENLGDGDLTLMQQIRWSWTTSNHDREILMRWEIPINAGEYDVRLYFGEGCCTRAADVAAENAEPVRVYYNGLAEGDEFPEDQPYAAGAIGTVTIAEFERVAVSDGFLSLAFDPYGEFNAPYDNNGTVSAIEILEAGPPAEQFKRGDVNADDQVDIADAIALLGHLFASEAAPSCPDAADANDDGALDIADAIKILGHLFGGEGPLPAPFGACGVDEVEDALGPCVYPPCGE